MMLAWSQCISPPPLLLLHTPQHVVWWHLDDSLEVDEWHANRRNDFTFLWLVALQDKSQRFSVFFLIQLPSPQCTSIRFGLSRVLETFSVVLSALSLYHLPSWPRRWEDDCCRICQQAATPLSLTGRNVTTGRNVHCRLGHGFVGRVLRIGMIVVVLTRARVAGVRGLRQWCWQTLWICVCRPAANSTDMFFKMLVRLCNPVSTSTCVFVRWSDVFCVMLVRLWNPVST